MKKLILVLSLLVLVSCTGMREAQRDDYMYESADPTEAIKISDKSHRQILAEEKAEQLFSTRDFYETIIHNTGPNRFIPEFPELFINHHVDERSVFSFR